MSQVIIQANGGSQWLSFANPVEVVVATRPGEVIPALQTIEQKVEENGWYAAGFISYEAALAFGLTCHTPSDFPLLWFGLYPTYQSLNKLPTTHHAPRTTLQSWQPNIPQTHFNQSIERIKAHIASGHTYQVNYTFRLHSQLQGEPYSLFTELAQAQQGEFSAYVDTGEHAICSASPELFFQLNGNRLYSRPMKGTAKRGLTLKQDEANVEWLYRSEKNRAENVMIVDMIRNDMGRVATVGSVQVPQLFTVERYPTVLQMTSTVESLTTASFTDIIANLFPCASITGAPKVRTMELIKELETTPRGLYTGSIGYLAPGRIAQFNVAIRTVVVDKRSGRAEYGVGSGIVWDSEASDEYRECQTKAQVLTQRRPTFQLLETMLWTADAGYFLLDYHLKRLADSATYFKYPLNLVEIEQALILLTSQFSALRYKVRLLVDEEGAFELQHFELGEVDDRVVRLGVASRPVNHHNPFLYHKTTHRHIYQQARAEQPHYDDIILWNENHELTETTIANIVLEIDGELLTPPISSGLLAGTYRSALLDCGKIHERTLTLNDLHRCQNIYLINSVQQWRTAQLSQKPA